jgi:hypothetical protein
MKVQQTTAAFLAAVVSRHGAGRLLPVADRQPDLADYLKTEDFARRPLAWLDADQPQSRHLAQLFADLRL